MKKQTLIKEVLKMQKLAGIITENEYGQQMDKIDKNSNDEQIKNYILSNFQYNENDFESSYNADTNFKDLLGSTYNEQVYINNVPFSFYQKLLKMVKNSPNIKHQSWGDYYEKSWELKTYPFEDLPGKKWTESLVVNVQIPNNLKIDNMSFEDQFEIYIERSVPFDEDMMTYSNSL